VVKNKFEIEWTDLAISSLQDIYNFYVHKSKQAANNVINDILDSPETIKYSNQYQIDELFPEFRRIVVRDYKVLYLVNENVITVYDVICTLTNPSKQKTN